MGLGNQGTTGLRRRVCGDEEEGEGSRVGSYMMEKDKVKGFFSQ